MPNINNAYDFAFDWSNYFNMKTVELRRETESYSRDRGYYTPEAKVADIEVSIQPMNESDLVSLPEGDREKDVSKIYTKYEVLKNDIIEHLGVSYKIKSPPQVWQVADGTLHHYKAFIYKIEND